MFVEDVVRDDVGRKLMGKNPMRLKLSTRHERDLYMVIDVSPENVEGW